MKAILEVISGSHAGRRFEFGGHDTFLVGRGADAHLSLADDPHFSRHHFLLELNPPQCFLRDLGSLNGTLVNGVRAAEAHLKHGDVVSGGKTKIRFTTSQDGDEATAIFQPHEMLPVTPPPPRNSARGSAVRLRIEGYEVLRKLGAGGMGEVHLARRLATGEEVALKVVLPESAASEVHVQRFLREAIVLSRLDHRRIVRFLDLGMAHGQIFIAMEYVPAVDLRAALADRGEKSRVKAVCGIACQVLEALHYAHGLGFVHRDIKPSNILVTQEGKRIRSKLADFGLAKNVANAGLSGMTREGQTLGTVAFMSPEQITHSRDARPASDVYSLSATLYCLLADRFAHEYPPGKDPLLVVLEDDPVPLLQVRPDLPKGLAEIVRRGMAKVPRERFPSARDMWKALAPFAKGER